MSVQDPEAWLAARLQDHGVDIYAGGEFPTLRDRLAYAIVKNQFGAVVAGRHDGHPETYQQFFERIFETKLNYVPRGTVSQTRQSSSGR